MAQYLALRAARQRRPAVLVFLDVEKAYDRLDRHRLWTTLLDTYRLPPALVGALQQMYTDLEASLKWQGGFSAPFPMTEGVRQGCPCSPLLFSLVYERIVQAVTTTLGYRVLRRTALEIADVALSLLLYADDLLVCSRSIEGASRLVAGCAAFCAAEGLTIHPQKSKVLAIAVPTTTAVRLGDLPLPFVTGVRYLGLELSGAPGQLTTHLARRLQTAEAAFTGVRRLCAHLHLY